MLKHTPALALTMTLLWSQAPLLAWGAPIACTSDAATMLRDLVYTAWLDGAAQPGGTPTVQPISPQHPQYNPATGSAPAGKPGGR